MGYISESVRLGSRDRKMCQKGSCVQKMGYLANSYGENGPFEDFYFFVLSEFISIMGSILQWKNRNKNLSMEFRKFWPECF